MRITPYPLHTAQQDIYTDQLIDLTSSQYNIGGYLKLKGPLNTQILHEVVAAAPKVFDAFKIRFDIQESVPVCYFDEDYDECKMADVDFSGHTNPSEAAICWMQERFNTPFQLHKNKPLFEQCLLKIADDEHWFFGRYHHLMADGYGFVVWIQYMAQKYQSLMAGDGQVFNYPSYQEEIMIANKNLHSSDYESDAAYWKEKIYSKPEKLLQKKYHKSNTDRRSITYILNLTPDQRAQLENLQLLTKSGLQQLTIAALLIYLGKTTNQTEFIFGIPVHKRSSKRLRSVVGTFTGILPFKGAYQPSQILAGFLKEIAASQRTDYRHQNYLVGDLTRHLKINTAEGYLSDIIINYEPLNFDLDFGEAIQATILRLTNEDERNPLKIVWRDYSIEQPLQLHIHFSNEYFSLEEIKLLAQRLIFMLKQFPAHLEETVENISILPEAETCLLNRFNDTEIAYPLDKTIVAVFEEQVARTPDLEAVVFGQERLTYAAINEKANQLAHYLKSQSLTAETLVAIYTERSVEMIVAILGILKAGGAYVPIDADYPAERISYILEDSSATMLITSKKLCATLITATIHSIVFEEEREIISSHPVYNLPHAVAPHHLAYVIYTSGSTGKPKGVMIEHQSVVNLAFSQAEALRLQPGMKTLQFSSIGFDASCYEIFNTLLSGGCLVLCTKEDILTADGLKAVINTNQVVLAVLPPSYQHIIADDLGTIQTIVSAGEPLHEGVGRQIQSKGIRLINAYGPTENTVCASLSDNPILDNHTIVIGKPFANVQIYMLDSENNLLPLGSTGEICIGGAQVARGYLNRPALTAEKFIKNPFSNAPGARLYKTGDLGRWLPDGNIEYLGRIDDQVKIRGYRIEPGEIEQVLLQSGLVKQCVVLAVGDAEGNKRLVGYVIVEGLFDKEDITTYLYEQLPEYMVPAIWVAVESFALTASGKIDRKALPDTNKWGTTAETFAAPRNEFEQKLAAVWQELLEVEKIGIHDNFFEVGGDSIITIQLVSRARQLGYALEVGDVFTYQTIAALSNRIAEKSGNHQLVVEQGAMTGACGLLPIQQWYLQNQHTHISYYNQSVLLSIDKAIAEPVLQDAIAQIMAHHDALRFRYYQQEGIWHQEYGTAKAGIITEDIRLKQQASPDILINKIVAAHQSQLDITEGDLVRFVWIQTPESEENNRLLIVIHHLAVDGVSWRILLEDLQLLINGFKNGKKHELGPKTSSFRQWYDSLRKYSNSHRLQSQTVYWKQVISNYSPLPVDHVFEGAVSVKDISKHTIQLTPEQTRSLLQEVPRVYHTGINDILLAASAKTLCEWSGADKIVIGLEGHGREQIDEGIDTSRTVGWFTTLFPVLLKAAEEKKIDDWIKTVKEDLRQVPDKGLGYGVLRLYQ